MMARSSKEEITTATATRKRKARPPWKDEAECLQARHAFAYQEAMFGRRPSAGRPASPSKWPSTLKRSLRRSAEVAKDNGRLEGLCFELGALASKLRADLEAFRAKVQEREKIFGGRSSAELGAIDEVVEIVRLEAEFAHLRSNGRDGQTRGRHADPSRLRAVAMMREQEAATGWRAEGRDLALLSILEGAKLHPEWAEMTVKQLIADEERAMRPYLGKK